MSSLIAALDNMTPKQTGENGHAEHAWSNNLQECILQFNFQCVRVFKYTNETLSDGNHPLRLLSRTLNELLSVLRNHENKADSRFYLSVLYKMIGQTRDMVDGKGECALSYMMIRTWYDFYPQLAKFALQCFVNLGDARTHPFGSWKDIKYFCSFCRNWDGADSDVFKDWLSFCVLLINDQLARDETAERPSLLAKWVPREKSAFGWMYEPLATQCYPSIMATASTPEQHAKAVLKCKTMYRKRLASINQRLDTLQIKQCGKQWSAIDFEKVTSVSLTKQRKALLNLKRNGDVRSEEEDRVTCAMKFTEHIQRAVRGEVEMKGKRVSMADFTKSAIRATNTDEIQLIDTQWNSNASQTGNLGNLIAMVDTSGSMDGDPINVAVALGIRIAEKSALGNRVLTFETSPKWVNLDPYPTFVDKVKHLVREDWGGSTNFYAALSMILDAIVEAKLAPEVVQDMALVILSDMQIDQGDKSDRKALYDVIQEKYAEAGMRVHGVPYKAPHLVFWNLRGTSGFPALSSDTNTSMMSGFSPALLNHFCDKGVKALESCSPWQSLLQLLDNERYQCLSERLMREV